MKNIDDDTTPQITNDKTNTKAYIYIGRHIETGQSTATNNDDTNKPNNRAIFERNQTKQGKTLKSLLRTKMSDD